MVTADPFPTLVLNPATITSLANTTSGMRFAAILGLEVSGSWLVWRVSPDSNPIEIEELLAKRDEEILLHAMDSEAGNVHLGEQLRAKSPQGPAVPKA
jgi:hypothetical protein